MSPSPMDTTINNAARKLAKGQFTHLNFNELRTLGLKFGESWERELEMEVDRATHNVVGLALQFFVDGRGPNQGYSGAIKCLRGYVGESCAPGLTKEDCDALSAAWASIAECVHKRCLEKEASLGGVEYVKILGIWFHAGSGSTLRGVDESGNVVPVADIIASLEDAAEDPDQSDG
ncbi:MAG: hypothetical protein BWY85_00125 [Firmicutes bacterium ADurb.Bin506]|nr:MAG: hypothetical protein BWY85_00125 [Firmicutes bacterium ADurb.Bin506]